MRKPAVFLLLLGGVVETVAAHSQPGTPGIDLHNLPIWGWAAIAAVLLGIIHFMYAKSHDRPLNPLKW